MDFKKTSKYSVSLGTDIAQILGFHAHTPYYATPDTGLKLKPSFQSSAQGNLDHMLIYCDAIEQSYMSNELSNIFIMISQEYTIHASFKNHVWHKVDNGANAESIQFIFTDLGGNPIAFYDGTTIIV